MAWTEVKCNDCGNTYQVQMYGKQKDREWKVRNWHGYCNECQLKYKEQKDKEIEEENQKNAEIAKESGYAILEGTPKQISWAETLRIQRIDFIKILLGKAIQEGKEEYAEWLKSKIYDTQKETKASFFIDRRGNKEEKFVEGFENYKLKQIAEKNL